MRPGRKVTVRVKAASELEERMPLEIYEGLFGEWRDSERRANPCNAKWSEVPRGKRGAAAVCRWRWFIRWLEKQVCSSSWNGSSPYFYAEIIIVAFPAQEIANRELTGKRDLAPITSHPPNPAPPQHQERGGSKIKGRCGGDSLHSWGWSTSFHCLPTFCWL